MSLVGHLPGPEVPGNTFQFADGPGLSHPTSDMLSRIESLKPEDTDREMTARIDLQTQKEIIINPKLARYWQSCTIDEYYPVRKRQCCFPPCSPVLWA
jgi:hypothetical protein